MRRFLMFMFGIVTGGVVGSITALLLAPSSGMDLRQQIQQKTKNFFTEIEDAGKQKRNELELELQQLRSTDQAKTNP